MNREFTYQVSCQAVGCGSAEIPLNPANGWRAAIEATPAAGYLILKALQQLDATRFGSLLSRSTCSSHG
jgi:hypothetical protein